MPSSARTADDKAANDAKAKAAREVNMVWAKEKAAEVKEQTKTKAAEVKERVQGGGGDGGEGQGGDG